jgi:hypothetical protein
LSFDDDPGELPGPRALHLWDKTAPADQVVSACTG